MGTACKSTCMEISGQAWGAGRNCPGGSKLPCASWNGKFCFVWESVAAWLATKTRQQHLCCLGAGENLETRSLRTWKWWWIIKNWEKNDRYLIWKKAGKKNRRWLCSCLLGEDFLAKVQRVWLLWEHIKIRNQAVSCPVNTESAPIKNTRRELWHIQ